MTSKSTNRRHKWVRVTHGSLCEVCGIELRLDRERPRKAFMAPIYGRTVTVPYFRFPDGTEVDGKKTPPCPGPRVDPGVTT